MNSTIDRSNIMNSTILKYFIRAKPKRRWKMKKRDNKLTFTILVEPNAINYENLPYNNHKEGIPRWFVGQPYTFSTIRQKLAPKVKQWLK